MSCANAMRSVATSLVVDEDIVDEPVSGTQHPIAPRLSNADNQNPVN